MHIYGSYTRMCVLLPTYTDPWGRGCLSTNVHVLFPAHPNKNPNRIN